MISQADPCGLNFQPYQTDGFFDEVFERDDAPRKAANLLIEKMKSIPMDDLLRRQQAAEKMLLNLGITFNVYGDRSGAERIFPFDIIPRIISASEWAWIEKGLRQRIYALNCFINDIYHEQKILKDKIIPDYVIESSKCFLKPCIGLNPPKGIWCHVTGTDLVRDADGRVYVLEDNLRVPSGVSYVLENREVMKRSFPQVFEAMQVRPVFDYPGRLLDLLHHIAPECPGDPLVAVLTPGINNSAYFEHSFLAHQMGGQLVEGRDLIVEDGRVLMRTTKGFERVDVIYRRIDDTFLDPHAFRPDSMLGVPGVMEAYRAGRVAMANAPGSGIADDKVIYAYVPKIIKYYLGEEMIIPNVPTYVCWDDQQRDYVLRNLPSLVVKAADESGGYGMMVGPHTSSRVHEEFAQRIKEDPRKYIAQPTLALSRAPVIVGDHFEGRHIDLRPFILYGRDIWVMPGGLCRVALKKGSLVVNSSQGGGSKDTWVLRNDGSVEAPDRIPA